MFLILLCIISFFSPFSEILQGDKYKRMADSDDTVIITGIPEHVEGKEFIDFVSKAGEIMVRLLITRRHPGSNKFNNGTELPQCSDLEYATWAGSLFQ